MHEMLVMHGNPIRGSLLCIRPVLFKRGQYLHAFGERHGCFPEVFLASVGLACVGPPVDVEGESIREGVGVPTVGVCAVGSWLGCRSCARRGTLALVRCSRRFLGLLKPQISRRLCSLVVALLPWSRCQLE